jgi:hypothetical protein
VGREIRNHLDQAGIRERKCVVCLPLNWLLTVNVSVPEIPEEDVAEFLELEAERGFTAGHENLLTATSRSRAVSGDQQATLLGIPQNHVATLEQALKAAQLKPLSFSLGITALAGGPKAAGAGVLTLLVGPHGIDLQISAGGGLTALRSLDGVIEAEGSQRRIDADALAREIRITLGQLPPGLAAEVSVAKILCRGEMGRQAMPDIIKRVQASGLRVEPVERYEPAPISPAPPAELASSPALALAANRLLDLAPGPEFLPPKINPWKQMLASGYSSKRLVWAGAGAGGVAVCILLAFLWQEWEISRLQSHLNSIAPQVAELKTDHDQITKYRPWYDTSFTGLRILRRVTEAFPEEGYVTAKTLEVRELNNINCSGTARDSQAYLALENKLGGSEDGVVFKTDSLTGQSPVRFTFNLQLGGANGPGN